MTFYVYVYIDTERDIPMYVGKGKNARCSVHLRNASNLKLRNRISALKANGLKPEIVVYSQPDEETALREEVALIAKYGRRDLDTGTLYNMTDGGEGKSGWIPSAQTRARISKSNSNPPLHVRQKQSAWIRSEETKRKIAVAQRDAIARRTAEEKEAMDRSRTVEFLTVETRAKMSAAAHARKILTCPHCGKIGGSPGMRRHHFDRCAKAEPAAVNSL